MVHQKLAQGLLWDCGLNSVHYKIRNQVNTTKNALSSPETQLAEFKKKLKSLVLAFHDMRSDRKDLVLFSNFVLKSNHSRQSLPDKNILPPLGNINSMLSDENV